MSVPAREGSRWRTQLVQARDFASEIGVPVVRGPFPTRFLGYTPATVNTREALAFVEQHGIVLVSGKSKKVPTLVDALAGEPVKGSWWSHPRARAIFAILSEVVDSGEVRMFRLVDDKVTMVHRRLWPALVALADEVGERRLTAVSQEHTRSGKHEAVRVRFPEWVPSDTAAAAKKLSRDAARAALAVLLT